MRNKYQFIHFVEIEKKPKHLYGNAGITTQKDPLAE